MSRLLFSSDFVFVKALFLLRLSFNRDRLFVKLCFTKRVSFNQDLKFVKVFPIYSDFVELDILVVHCFSIGPGFF